MTATVVALYAAAFLYHHYRTQRERWEEFVLWPLLGIANALTVTALSLELVSYFDSRALADDSFGYQPIHQRATDAKLLSLTALWSIYGFILAAGGLWRRWPLVRWAGLVLLGLTILKLITIDTIAVRLAQLGFPARAERAIPDLRAGRRPAVHPRLAVPAGRGPSGRP